MPVLAVCLFRPHADCCCRSDVSILQQVSHWLPVRAKCGCETGGSIAEVTVPISAQGVGEIALVAQGGRVTYPARATAGIPIAKGTLVTIDQMIGTQALVSPTDSVS